MNMICTSKINSTKIIGLSVLFILIMGFLIFFFTVQYASQSFGMELISLQKDFFSQLDPNTDKIFIIGSSHVYSIDPILIKERLLDLEQNYDVHNLSIGGMSIQARSKTIDLAIAAKPKIIIYGIAGDDFADNIRRVDIKLKTPESIFPDPQKSFKNILTNSFLEKYDFLESPRHFLMVKMLNYVDSDLQILSENISESNTPFILLTEKNYKAINNTDIRITFDHIIYPTISPVEKNKTLVIFKNMLEKFKENDIKVIIFTTPFNEVYLDNLPNDNKKQFKKIIENIVNEFDLKIYDLTDKYSKLQVWGDYQHIALGSYSKPYSEDIIKIIISEIKN